MMTRLIALLVLCMGISACHQSKKSHQVETSPKYSNELIHASSPYLLQHAHNPVNWRAWKHELFQEAQANNQLVLISIGYSACHWCHVMERECFEDEEVAAFMNKHFICIKVDREELPDVDQVYMKAVQMMTGQGGWPLNCFTLPDGRPIYGGTYFPKERWLGVMEKLIELKKDHPEELEKYAHQLTQGLKRTENLVKIEAFDTWDHTIVKDMVGKWSTRFDDMEGGAQGAPKFPMPNNYSFLLKYAICYNDTNVLNHVKLTANKMAQGGIYDQIGGGFARYSVDAHWKVPHFEKMLYDNAQLLQFYSELYTQTGNKDYERLIHQTSRFVEEEFLSEEGVFYSALDADSEGEEGLFYIWKEEEIEAVSEHQELAKDYYNINPKGYWEDGHYILLRTHQLEHYAQNKGLSTKEIEKMVDAMNSQLKGIRNQRIKPGLDDKALTSWNALMDIGWLQAYRSTGEKKY